MSARAGELVGLLVARTLFLLAAVGALVALLWPGFPLPEVAAPLVVIFAGAYAYLRWRTAKLLRQRPDEDGAAKGRTGTRGTADRVLASVTLLVPKDVDVSALRFEDPFRVVGPMRVFRIGTAEVATAAPEDRNERLNEALHGFLTGLPSRGASAEWIRTSGSSLKVYVSLMPEDGDSSVIIRDTTLKLIESLGGYLQLDAIGASAE